MSFPGFGVDDLRISSSHLCHSTAAAKEGFMQEQARPKYRRNRVFKSLHKPLTYLGVERTLFFFICVGAVGTFNLFNSLLAGVLVFIGGYAFGSWVTNADPAFLRILARSEKYKLRYDAAKQVVPRVEVH
jgi:type IV secretory pathway TrbD component